MFQITKICETHLLQPPTVLLPARLATSCGSIWIDLSSLKACSTLYKKVESFQWLCDGCELWTHFLLIFMFPSYVRICNRLYIYFMHVCNAQSVLSFLLLFMRHVPILVTTPHLETRIKPFGGYGNARNNVWVPAWRQSWSTHTEKLSHYFVANKVTEAEQKRVILFAVCGPMTFKLIKSLAVNILVVASRKLEWLQCTVVCAC